MRDKIPLRNSSSLVNFRSKRTKVAIELIKLGIILIFVRSLKIGAAYETLKDESKRREYDRSQPKLRSKSATSPPKNTQGYTSSPKPASSDYNDESRAAAALAAIQKSKYERASRWWKKQTEFDNDIGELKREGQQLPKMRPKIVGRLGSCPLYTNGRLLRKKRKNKRREIACKEFMRRVSKKEI
jgi:curved DNA-binding protein CbpA